MLTQAVLIVDAYNVFMRSYCAYPAMSPQGEHIGGLVGFVKTLRRMVDEMQPARVFVVWEGGGSSRRRTLYGAYKANRKPGKLNRFYEDDIPDTDENKLEQVARLVKLLKGFPVCQLYVSDVEADDVIALLAKRLYLDKNKVILSTDKDMYQLLDEKTHVYDLNKKAYVTPETVRATYMIPPRNFALAKTLCGDGSDNIPGVRGCGFKTVAKRFPFLIEDRDVLLQEIVDFASTRVDEAAVYRNVAAASEQLRTNWRLVYLDGSMLSPVAITRLENVISSFSPTVDKLALMKACLEFGASNHLDIHAIAYSMRGLLFTSDDKKADNTK